MDTASNIGYILVVIFLLAVIIRLWKDNRNEKCFWKSRKWKDVGAEKVYFNHGTDRHKRYLIFK